MKRGFVIICCCFIIGFGCQKAKRQAISQEDMVNILIDVHLVEASLLGFSDEQKDSLSQLYYQQIYEIHSVSEEEFMNEMAFLKRHPDDLSLIYEKVLEEIGKRETELK